MFFIFLSFAELQSIFEMFDKNKDGKISCEELGVVLRTLGHRYSQEEIQEMIKNADKNGEKVSEIFDITACHFFSFYISFSLSFFLSHRLSFFVCLYTLLLFMSASIFYVASKH